MTPVDIAWDEILPKGVSPVPPQRPNKKGQSRRIVRIVGVFGLVLVLGWLFLPTIFRGVDYLHERFSSNIDYEDGVWVEVSRYCISRDTGEQELNRLAEKMIPLWRVNNEVRWQRLGRYVRVEAELIIAGHGDAACAVWHARPYTELGDGWGFRTVP